MKKKNKKKQKKDNMLKVKTPMGTLIAYPSTDPMNPGIFIDLKREGHDADLNLSGTECQIDEDRPERTQLVSHIWGSGSHEDTTHDVTHDHVDCLKRHRTERR